MKQLEVGKLFSMSIVQHISHCKYDIFCYLPALGQKIYLINVCYFRRIEKRLPHPRQTIVYPIIILTKDNPKVKIFMI